jgi:protocatechuate 3,4-dioxygenase, beta subunit
MIMAGQHEITRRQLMQTGLAFAGLATAAPFASALAAEENKWALTETTPGTVMGPFYPLVNKGMDPGTDLTAIKGGAGRAQGQLLYLMGQVLDIKGKPIKGVKVEIWQTNAAGRYNHPSDPNPAPLDPNFLGYGIAVTDGEGRYRFKTVKPGAYPVAQGWERPPHVHYELTGRVDRHVTQMWFPGEPLNAQDRLFARLSPAAQTMLTGKLEAPTANVEPEAKIAVFNIVLTNG